MVAVIDYFKINKFTLFFACKWTCLLFTATAVIMSFVIIKESFAEQLKLLLAIILSVNLIGLIILLLIFGGCFVQNRKKLQVISAKTKTFKETFNLQFSCLHLNSKTQFASVVETLGESLGLKFKVVCVNPEIRIILLFSFSKEISPEQEKVLADQHIGIWGIGLYKRLTWKKWKNISSEDMYGILELLKQKSIEIENA